VIDGREAVCGEEKNPLVIFEFGQENWGVISTGE